MVYLSFFHFLISFNFWNGIKLALDILQSLVITLATIIAGVWALKTFGYDERLRQLEKVNRSVLNLKEAISALHTWQILNSLMEDLPQSPQLEGAIFRAQSDLRDSFDASMRLDFFKKIEWSTRLLPYMYNLPPSFMEDVTYKKIMSEFTEVSADIVREGHFGLPKWLRTLSSFI